MSIIRQVILQDPEVPERVIKFDPIFRGILVVTKENRAIHEGKAFSIDLVDESMGNGDVISLVFKTMGGFTRVHMHADFSVLVSGYLQFWEGATWTTGTGSLSPIINHKREVVGESDLLEDLTATPAFTVTNNVVVNATGISTVGATLILSDHTFGIKNKISGGGSAASERILKPDTQYAILFTSTSTNNKAQATIDWFEFEQE